MDLAELIGWACFVLALLLSCGVVAVVEANNRRVRVGLRQQRGFF